MKNNHCEITISDPERWNLKYTDKRKHYIQLHGNFWSDSDFLALSSGQKVMFLWILNASLRVNKPSLSICLESAKGILKCSLDEAKGLLSGLESFNIISLQTRVRKTTKPQLIEENRIEEKRREANENKTESKSDSEREPFEVVVDTWNKGAPHYNFPKVKVINAARKKAIKSAMKDFPDPEDWKKIFNVAATKGFERNGAEPFVPNWDYIFRNNNWVKFYDEYEILFPEEGALGTNEKAAAQAEEYLKKMVGM